MANPPPFTLLAIVLRIQKGAARMGTKGTFALGQKLLPGLKFFAIFDPMEIRQREENTAWVLTLSGNLTHTDNAQALHQAAKAALEAKALPLVINLEQVPLMDSLGIGSLISLRITAQRLGVACHLVGLQPKVQEVLTITKLLPMFSVAATEAEVL